LQFTLGYLFAIIIKTAILSDNKSSSIILRDHRDKNLEPRNQIIFKPNPLSVIYYGHFLNVIPTIKSLILQAASMAILIGQVYNLWRQPSPPLRLNRKNLRFTIL